MIAKAQYRHWKNSPLRPLTRIAVAAVLVSCFTQVLAAARGAMGSDHPPIAPAAHATTLGRQQEGYLALDLLFATDRAKSGSNEPGEYFGNDRGTLRFGACRVSIPAGHERGKIEDSNMFTRDRPQKHLLLVDKPTEQERPEFIRILSDRVQRPPSREVLVIVHGYNVTFEQAVLRTAQMAFDIQFEGVPIVYSWPAQGHTLSYTVDQTNAAWSRPHLVEFLRLLLDHAGATRIHLLGHSLGNRVLSDALVELTRGRAATNSPMFGQVILAAPDIDSAIFVRDTAPHLVNCSERITIYASSKDHAIAGSRTLHRYPRLGEAGKHLTLFRKLSGIEVVDATGARKTMLGHTYFSVSPRFLDDLRGVLAGQEPIDRDLCAEDGYFVFHP